MRSPNRFYEDRIDPLFERLIAWFMRVVDRIPPRVMAYGTPALLTLAYLIWSWRTGNGNPFMDRGLAYLCVAIVMGVGSRAIRAFIDYHPMYAVEKAVYTGGLLILAAQTWLNLSIKQPWVIWIFIVLFAVATIVSLEFILRRNIDLNRKMVHTREGAVPMLPRDQANRLSDHLRAEIRHNNVDREYLDELIMEIGRSDPESSEYWVTRRTREVREKNARRVRLVAGAEADAAEGDH